MLAIAYSNGAYEPEDKALDVGSTYLSNHELGVLNDVSDVQLEGCQSSTAPAPFLSNSLTLVVPAIPSNFFSWVIHSSFSCLPPTLCKSVREFRKATYGNGDLRGGEELVGHTIRQVGKEALDVLRFERLLEFLGKLALGGHG